MSQMSQSGRSSRAVEKHGLYHLEDETPLIVHPGIGTTKISARFGVLPTIELIELTI